MKTPSDCPSFSSNSKLVRFTVFEDCSGQARVFDREGLLMFYSEDGTHKDKIKEIKKQAKVLRARADLLDKAAKEMSECSGKLSCIKRY